MDISHCATRRTLRAYIKHARFEFKPWQIRRMALRGVPLFEVYFALERGSVQDAIHARDFGHVVTFQVENENCDGEIIRVFGSLDLITGIIDISDAVKL